MPESAFEVIHQIPGRIRVRIPMLNGNLDDQAALEQQVQALTAVKTVRVNSIARSIVIQYDDRAVPEAAFCQQLTNTLQFLSPLTPPEKAAETDASESVIPAYEANQLTDYERVQFEEIQNWQHQEIFWLRELVGQLLLRLKGLFSLQVLARVVEQIGAACDAVTANWQQDWADLQPKAGVETIVMLRQGSLETCDRLAERVTLEAVESAIAEGGITGLFDLFGEVVDDGLMVVLALKTIHRIGLCYGYPPETPTEKAFAWAIFNAGVAQTQEEYVKTQGILRDLHRSLHQQTLATETLEDSLEEDANEMVLDAAIEQALTELTEETAAGLLPPLGIVLSVLADRDLIEQISTAARREFQLRWLLENQKVCFPDSQLRPPLPRAFS